MRNINRAIISGNLTRDAELRRTQSGLPVLSFSVAVNDSRKTESGWEDKPNYIDCVMMGDRAEKLSEYLVKGTKVCVEGRLSWSQWERDGQKRSKVEVKAEQVEFMSKGQQKPPRDDYSAVYDDDCPF